MSVSAQWKKLNLGLNTSTVVGKVLHLTDRSIVDVGNSTLYQKLDSDTVWYRVEGNDYTKYRLGEMFFTLSDTLIATQDLSLTSSNSLYFSKDKGSTWTERKVMFEGNPKFKYFVVDADSLYFLSFSPTTLYVTGDVGLSYQKKNIPDCDYLAKVNRVYFTARSPIHSGDTVTSGIMRSVDYGKTWKTANKGLSNKYITFFISKDTLLYAGTVAGLYVSSDYGEHWSYASIALPDQATFFDYEGDNLLLYARNTLYLSNDNGGTWSSISDSIALLLSDKKTRIENIALYKGVVYISTSRGLFSTNDMGVHWKSEVLIGASPGASHSTVSNSKLYIAPYQFGLFESENEGQSWTRIDSNFSGQLYFPPDIGNLSVNSVSIVAPLFFSNTVYTTPLNPLQWQYVNTGINNGVIYGVINFNDKFFMSHSTGLYTSYDGFDWKKNDSLVGEVRVYPSFADTLFLSNKNRILYSIDGNRWYSYSQAFSEQIIDFRKNEYYTYAKTTYYEPSIGTQFHNLLSTNKGLTWDTLNFEYVSDVLFYGKQILISAEKQGVLYSNNGGKEWLYRNEGMILGDSLNGFTFRVIGNTLFAIGGTAMYKDKLDSYINSIEDERVTSYLYVNAPYPIPANNVATLQLYWTSDIVLEESDCNVYSLLGEPLMSDGAIQLQKQGQGSGILTWDCSLMSQGVYILKIKHGTKTTSVKIIVSH